MERTRQEGTGSEWTAKETNGMNEATLHPIDFAGIRRGDVITFLQLQAILRDKNGELIDPADYQRWQLAVLAFRQRIETECDRLGYPVVIAQRAGDLYILTTTEANEYLERQFEKSRHQMARRHVQRMKLNVAELDDDHLRSHENRILRGAAILCGMRKGMSAYRLEAQKRLSPGVVTTDTNGVDANGTEGSGS